MVEVTPMPTDADLWKAKFCEYIVGMLTLDGQGYSIVIAQRMAQDEYDSLEDQTGDPVESAMECLSYWEDDGDDSANDGGSEHE